MGIQCPFCGQVHPPVSRFCPSTGQALPGPAAPGVNPAAVPAYGARAQYAHGARAHGAPADGRPSDGPRHGGHGADRWPSPPLPPSSNHAAAMPMQGQQAPAAGSPAAAVVGAPSKATPIGALLLSAFDLYQKNFIALITACALLMVPVALVKAGVTSLMLAPVSAATTETIQISQAAATRLREDADEARHDPARAQELERDEQKQMDVLERAGRRALGGFAAAALGFLVTIASIAILYAVAVPLTTAALTILVADRATGGTSGSVEAYKRLLARLPALLSATIPAFFFVLMGLCLLLIPGLILGLLFIFVTPVVMLENVGGIAALKRSVTLVSTNLLQVVVVALVFAVMRFAASITAGFLVPHAAFFLKSLAQDLLLLFLLPIPIVGTVLLYLDVRRQAEGLDERAIRAALSA